MDKIIVAIVGVIGMVFTYWFFLMKRDKEVAAVGAIDVIVEGGYSPAAITVKQGSPTVLNFLRKDQNSCLEEVVVPEFKIKQFLPLNQKVSIEIIPKQKGEFVFSCGMGMYHGKIIVR